MPAVVVFVVGLCFLFVVVVVFVWLNCRLGIIIAWLVWGERVMRQSVSQSVS